MIHDVYHVRVTTIVLWLCILIHNTQHYMLVTPRHSPTFPLTRASLTHSCAGIGGGRASSPKNTYIRNPQFPWFWARAGGFHSCLAGVRESHPLVGRGLDRDSTLTLLT